MIAKLALLLMVAAGVPVVNVPPVPVPLADAAAPVAAQRMRGTVFSVMRGGVLLRRAEWVLPRSYEALPNGAAFVLCDTASMVDGVAFDALVVPAGKMEYTASGGVVTVLAFKMTAALPR